MKIVLHADSAFVVKTFVVLQNINEKSLEY